jgi:hypothetical protein
MNETDDLFSPRQIAQIKLANSKIRASLQLDEHDYDLDERNLRKALENLSLKSGASTDSRQQRALPSQPRSQLVVALSDLLSPVGVAGLLIAFALGSAGTLFLELPAKTQNGDEIRVRSAKSVAADSEGKMAAERQSETVNNQVSSTIVSGDNLSLPGSTPLWMQVMQLAVEGNGLVTIQKSSDELRVLISIDKENSDRLLGLRIALGLRPDFYGPVIVVFSNP